MTDEDDRDDGPLGKFTLPPIELPPLTLPEDVRLVVPAFERPRRVRVRFEGVVLVAATFDALDLFVAFTVGPETAPWLRLVAGTVLSTLFAGAPDLAYVWEGVAAGVGWLTAAPTATLLVLLGLVR